MQILLPTSTWSSVEDNHNNNKDIQASGLRDRDVDALSGELEDRVADRERREEIKRDQEERRKEESQLKLEEQELIEENRIEEDRLALEEEDLLEEEDREFDEENQDLPLCDETDCGDAENEDYYSK